MIHARSGTGRQDIAGSRGWEHLQQPRNSDVITNFNTDSLHWWSISGHHNNVSGDIHFVGGLF